MQKYVIRLFFIIVFSFATLNVQAVEPAKVTIIYSGNLDGELESCGCSEEGDLGGILRRSTKIEQLKKEQPNLFLISSGGLLTSESSRDKLKSDYILRGFTTMGYDAIGMQWSDLSYGSDFLKTDSLPWTASNWVENETVPLVRKVTHGNVTMAFFSWLDPKKSPFRKMQGEHRAVHDDIEVMQKAIQDAKKQGQLTVVATSWSLKKTQRMLNLDDVDVLIIRSAYEEYGEPQLLGNTLIVQPGSRGMRLGRIDLNLKEASRISKWKHEILPMPSTIPDAPSLKDWYQEYNAKVKEAYLASVELRKSMDSGESPYSGGETCQACHLKEHEIWSTTAHAHAFERLQEVNKAFDPDCIVCHTVGFDKEGGYIDFKMTPHLMNVQCESCHGAGKAHVESGGKTPVANADWVKEQICGQCHTQPHSPSFKVEDYWPRIAH